MKKIEIGTFENWIDVVIMIFVIVISIIAKEKIVGIIGVIIGALFVLKIYVRAKNR